MKDADLNRAVAHATGESVSTIKHLGFQLDETVIDREPNSEDLAPYLLDWDTIEAERLATFAACSAVIPAVKHPRFSIPMQPCES